MVIGYRELESVLSGEEYKREEIEHIHINEFETWSKWTTLEVLNLFDDMMIDGVPPTQKDYIEKGTELTKEYWFSQNEKGIVTKYVRDQGRMRSIYLTWDERIEQNVRYRLSRMYDSFLVEYSLLCALKEREGTKLLASEQIDLTLGVDVVAVDTDTKSVVYGHVVKDSRWADRNIRNKAKKKSWLRRRNGHKFYWQRRFNKNHVVLKYDDCESSKMNCINGNVIFDKDYIISEFEELFEKSTDSLMLGELKEFHDWLQDNKLFNGGVTKMMIA